jgi:hypothetical protein
MDKYIVFSPELTKSDRLVLENLATDVRLCSQDGKARDGEQIQPGTHVKRAPL